MKKIIGLFFITITAIGLAACGKKDYKYDGVFTAFELGVNSKAAQITWVDVTIKDGKVTKYNIDARQGKIVDGAHVWNEKTKKELGPDYGMVQNGSAIAEWDEQAKLIEAFFLDKGPAALKTKSDNDATIDNITGVTMKDGSYSKLALAALENAKKGIHTAFEVGVNSKAAQVTWVDVTVNEKGAATKFFIDARQSKIVEAANVWNEKTKKELGPDYGMVQNGNAVAEWDEQAKLIEAFFLDKGADALKTKSDTDATIDNITGVTIKDGSYSKLALAALAKVSK